METVFKKTKVRKDGHLTVTTVRNYFPQQWGYSQVGQTVDGFVFAQKTSRKFWDSPALAFKAAGHPKNSEYETL
tara:strand:+ start:5996 stop:6217 length:222 start_codon:yes stop_codon:yes gene_type:complete